MLLSDLVATSTAVAATRSRKAKVAALQALLERTSPDELETVVSYLAGTLRQRRTGVGWRSLGSRPPAADHAVLAVTDVHEAFEEMASLSGPGSQARRLDLLHGLMRRATPAEQDWIRAVVTGNVRQGALEAVIQEAVAGASGLPLADVRRAAMLSGSTLTAAVAAFAGREALAAIGLEVGRAVQPMLASSAPDVATAVAGFDGPVAVDAKLDGIRIQVHRDGGDVLVVTRSLDDITARLPEVVDLVRRLPVRQVVLDGEAMALDDAGRPRAFQDTASRTAQAVGAAVRPTSSTSSTSTATTCSTHPCATASPRWTGSCPPSTAPTDSSRRTPPTRRTSRPRC